MRKIIQATHLEEKQPIWHNQLDYQRMRFSYLEDEKLFLIIYTSRLILTESTMSFKDMNSNHNHSHSYNHEDSSNNDTHNFF